MTLVNYPETLTKVIISQVMPLLSLLLLGLILIFMKKLFNNRRLKRIKPIDFFPLFALLTIPILTLDQQGNTWLPLLICLWMAIGIVGILYVIISTGDFMLKKFLFIFWRVSDLYWLFLYIVILCWKIIKVCY